MSNDQDIFHEVDESPKSLAELYPGAKDIIRFMEEYMDKVRDWERMIGWVRNGEGTIERIIELDHKAAKESVDDDSIWATQVGLKVEHLPQFFHPDYKKYLIAKLGIL